MKNCYPNSNPGRRARHGASLIEVLVACVLLAVMAVATSASLQYARSTAALQRNRRQALDLANSRLEHVRASAYTAVRPPALNTSLYYLRYTSGVWSVHASDPGESAQIAGRSRPMRTTVRYVDVDGGGLTYDCLRVAVSVQYSQQTNSLVSLETVKAP